MRNKTNIRNKVAQIISNPPEHVIDETKTYFKQFYGSSPTLTFKTPKINIESFPASPTLMSRLRLSSDVSDDMVQLAIDVCKTNGIPAHNDKTYRMNKKK